MRLIFIKNAYVSIFLSHFITCQFLLGFVVRWRDACIHAPLPKKSILSYGFPTQCHVFFTYLSRKGSFYLSYWLHFIERRTDWLIMNENLSLELVQRLWIRLWCIHVERTALELDPRPRPMELRYRSILLSWFHMRQCFTPWVMFGQFRKSTKVSIAPLTRKCPFPKMYNVQMQGQVGFAR